MRVLYYLKWPLVIFFAGAIIRIGGAMTKILHWYGADQIMLAGAVTMITGLTLLIYKLIVFRKNDWIPTDKS